MDKTTLPDDFFSIENLSDLWGARTTPSPLQETLQGEDFIDDVKDRVLVDVSLSGISHPLSFELAGPRQTIFWSPDDVKVAIVTCGGLAPGLNNVVQSLVNCLEERYGVRKIFGVPYGYQGFTHDTTSKQFLLGWQHLGVRSVQNIDQEGGSVLGTGRGHSNIEHIVDALVLRDIQVLFTVGGDGTLAGACALHKEIQKRQLPISVIGIPKTIDNDVLWVSKTFGFESAVERAAEALRCAQTEARSAYHGIGLVKIMGRNHGALTATAARAVSGVDFVLVPEVALRLHGSKGFLSSLVRKVLSKGYATIALAEGTGQDLFPRRKEERDASGNVKLQNIGDFLQQEIKTEFKNRHMEITLKYIDPSYMVRAQTTSADDSVFCSDLGQHAAHAAMAGKTGCMIGYAHERFTHVPLSAVAMGKKQMQTQSPLWVSVLAATGQPAQWGEISV